MAALPAVAARMDQLIAAGHGVEDASALAIDSVRRAWFLATFARKADGTSF
jgi:hypothetical protein